MIIILKSFKNIANFSIAKQKKYNILSKHGIIKVTNEKGNKI